MHFPDVHRRNQGTFPSPRGTSARQSLGVVRAPRSDDQTGIARQGARAGVSLEPCLTHHDTFAGRNAGARPPLIALSLPVNANVAVTVIPLATVCLSELLSVFAW